MRLRIMVWYTSYLGVLGSGGFDQLLAVLEERVGVGLAQHVPLHQVLGLQQVHTQHPHRSNLHISFYAPLAHITRLKGLSHEK